MVSGSPVSIVTARHVCGTVAAVSAWDSRVSAQVSSVWCCTARPVSWKPGDVKREVTLRKGLAPVSDQGGEHLAILVALFGVCFALVPDRSGDGQRCQWSHHALVEHGRNNGPVLEPYGQRLRRLRIDTDPRLPLTRQRNSGTVAKNEAQVIRFALEAAVWPGF